MLWLWCDSADDDVGVGRDVVCDDAGEDDHNTGINDDNKQVNDKLHSILMIIMYSLTLRKTNNV